MFSLFSHQILIRKIGISSFCPFLFIFGHLLIKSSPSGCCHYLYCCYCYIKAFTIRASGRVTMLMLHFGFGYQNKSVEIDHINTDTTVTLSDPSIGIIGEPGSLSYIVYKVIKDGKYGSCIIRFPNCLFHPFTSTSTLLLIKAFQHLDEDAESVIFLRCYSSKPFSI